MTSIVIRTLSAVATGSHPLYDACYVAQIKFLRNFKSHPGVTHSGF